MQQRALTPWAVLLATLLVAGLAVAQSSVDGRSDPLGESAPQAQTQRDINALYNLIFPIAVVIGILVEALLLYAIVRYRGKGGKAVDSGEHERGHHKLEIAWTIPPAVILLLVGLLSAQTLGAIETGPPRDFTVTVVGSQFSWGFRYPGEGPSDPLSNQLRVEVGKVVDLNITSTDVIHSFSVPSLGVKIDAIPGRVNHYWLRAEQPGEYQVQCMEYCGQRHAFMRTSVMALPPGSTARGWESQAGGVVDLARVDRVLDLHFAESGGNPWSAVPPTITAQGGQSLGVNFTNPTSNSAAHNITVIDDRGIVVGKIDALIPAGGHAATYLQPPAAPGGGPGPGGPVAPLRPGTYTYYCAVPGHRQLGMEGHLTVS